MQKLLPIALAALVFVHLPACEQKPKVEARPAPSPTPSPTPANPKLWQEEAVWYQIFPERFRNGDPNNDPIREHLDARDWAPPSWKLMPWGSDWYSRADWEKERAENFYWTVSERRYGGDLQGIIDKLDYIRDLGATAIYLNPVFASRSHHKYDTDAFHHIEPTFGPDPAGDRAIILAETEDPATWQWTAADKLFLKLLQEARARGLRVIIDGVFNHAGTEFFAYRDIMKNGRASRFTGWFVVDRWDDSNTPENETRIKGWHGIGAMPEFAEAWQDGEGDLAPGPKKYILDITRRWMDPNGDGDPSDGVDGWRLDVSWMVPNKFWREWNALVHDINPAAYTVTEIWQDPTKVTLGGHFDATMNYEGFAMPVKGWIFNNTFPPSKCVERLDRTRAEWPPYNAHRLQNLLDSHDTPRAASAAANENWDTVYIKPEEFDLAVDDAVSPEKRRDYRWQKPGERAWKLVRMAAVLQMTYPGTPFIYYGAEAGMWGANDPDCRKPMVWPDIASEPESHGPNGEQPDPQEVKFDEALHQFYRAAISMRRSHPALSFGSLQWLQVDDGQNSIVFLRRTPGEKLLVALNRHDQPQTLLLPCPEGWSAESATAFFTSDGSTATLKKSGAGLEIQIPSLTAAVFKP